MNIHRFCCGSIIGALFCLGGGWQSRAQFYAPETEYHDPVQRMFPVEAARVLAWWYNQSTKEPISEIRHRVITKPDQSTDWELNWLDKHGRPAKRVSLVYPATALKEGPEFYRNIFKHLYMVGWRQPARSAPAEVSRGYWKGASQMGFSREASLQTAWEIGRSEEAGRSLRSGELAGALVHTALPGVADRLSLDCVLVARGAAWLAFAEHCSASKQDGLWPPILFLAGREHLAAELWNKNYPAQIKDATPQLSGWNIWLRKPSIKDVYLFGTEAGNLAMAMPLLAYDIRVNNTGGLCAELLPELVGSRSQLESLHNYGPLLALHGTVGGGHIMNGHWPALSRAAFLKLLENFRPEPGDFDGYGPALQQARTASAKPRQPSIDSDLSVQGLPTAAPLLRLGQKEGIGPLIPTATVTARDLLNYGWEMAGLQLGSRYVFVERVWGVPELAESILKEATVEVQGILPFFQNASRAKAANYNASLQRLELLDDFFYRVGWSKRTFTSNANPLDNARLFVKRCWMRPRDFEWQARTLWDANSIQDILDLISALHPEGGPLATVEVLKYLTQLDDHALSHIPNGGSLKESLAETLPQPGTLYINATAAKYSGSGNFIRGQELERLFWRNPDSGLEYKIIPNYLISGAYASALRFYSQCRGNLFDTPRFSVMCGKHLYLLAYLSNNRKLREMVLEDSRSGSYSDMEIHIWDAAARRDAQALHQQVDELVDRYGKKYSPNSASHRLQRFLPLLPALANPAHPARKEALHYFGKDDRWATLCWIWIEQYRLPLQDAMTFLGGPEPGLYQQVLRAYLEKDAPKMLSAHERYKAEQEAKSTSANFLAMYLYYKLSGFVPPEDENLKPADAISARQAVLTKLSARK